MTPSNLIHRLETAGGAERGLARLGMADDIARQLFGSGFTIEHSARVIESLEGSIDATLALIEEVLPGYGWTVKTFFAGDDHCRLCDVVLCGEYTARNKRSVPIALLIALLKALQAKEAGQ